jgi:hypothetical protein
VVRDPNTWEWIAYRWDSRHEIQVPLGLKSSID